MSDWPETVPILTGRDIIKGTFHSSSGKSHCLHGWGHTVFPAFTGEVRGSTLQLFGEPLKALKDAMTETDITDSIVILNDCCPRAFSARVWNRAMYLLGYTEGNPENKPLSRKDLK